VISIVLPYLPPDKIAGNERFQGVFEHCRLFMKAFGEDSLRAVTQKFS
jgi:hypothetical protein